MFRQKLILPVLQIALLINIALFTPAKAQEKEEEKIKAATAVLNDFSQMKENIPGQLLEISQGIIIMPKLINAGFVVGGKHGRGIAMIKDQNGSWSDPVFVTITGGSFGPQIGVQAIDLVLVFKNSKTLTDIGTGSFTLGGDVSVAAGPMGRSSSAQTDYKLEAEVYSYSRSKGLFAGITLNGAVLSVDSKANADFYKSNEDANTILTSSNVSSVALTNLKDKLDSFK